MIYYTMLSFKSLTLREGRGMLIKWLSVHDPEGSVLVSGMHFTSDATLTKFKQEFDL